MTRADLRYGRFIVAPIALILFMPIGASFAQESLPPNLNLTRRAQMKVEAPTPPFRMIHGVLEFEPGTRFPAHFHGGRGLYTMIDGSVLLEDGQSEKKYSAGESYTQSTGEVLAASHMGAKESTMAVAFALSEGEELTTFAEAEKAGASRPAPEMIHDLASKPLTDSAPFSVIQMVLELEPGSQTPAHSHPGVSLATVLRGEVVLRRGGNDGETVTPRDGWVVASDEPITLSNTGERTARFVATYLLPEGEALATILE